MKRRQFVSKSLLAGITFYIPKYKIFLNDVILGHGDFQYKVLRDWGILNPLNVPIQDGHEMVMDKNGRIILLTNHVKNNFIYYNKSGKLLQTKTANFSGAHGLTYFESGGEEFLIVTDTENNVVVIMDIEANLIRTLDFPLDIPHYSRKELYKPTESAVTKLGDIYVSDGYGEQFILHYNFKGELINYFGGKGKEDDKFYNAHGIAIDDRHGSEELLVTARMKNQLKEFDLKGNFLNQTHIDGAFNCRPVIRGDEVYLATIWTNDMTENSGVLTILNKQNKVVSIPGANPPKYTNGKLDTVKQKLKVFKHPHDVCIDNDLNLYVPQWNSGQTYPLKLVRV